MGMLRNRRSRKSKPVVDVVDDEVKLTWSQKYSRLKQRLGDPEWLRYGRLLLAGKFIGLLVVAAIVLGGPCLLDMLRGGAVAHAQTAAADPYAAVKPAEHINPLNTAWVLLGAFLVFGMQAGFTMLEAGFCRNRETVNVLVECVFDTCVCGLLHWAWGFAFMFGGGNAFIGWHDPDDPTKSFIFMKDVGVLTVYGATGIPVFAHYLFQFAFADCASTICSGAMVGPDALHRRRHLLDRRLGVHLPDLRPLVLGARRLPRHDGHTAGLPLEGLGMNFHDFAGSTVVHSIGGWVAIAGAHRARAAHRSQVQARRRRPDARRTISPSRSSAA